MAKKEEKRVVWTTEKVKEAQKKLDEGYILKGYEIPFFEKTPGLRKGGITFKFTEEEFDEYIKCKMDIKYFIENYIFIKSEDGLFHHMKLRDYQHEIVDLYDKNKLSILMASRQVGKCFSYTTPILIYNKKLNVYKKVKFFQLLFKYKKTKTIYDYIKYGLYMLLSLVDSK
jgi:hypothetical protein